MPLNVRSEKNCTVQNFTHPIPVKRIKVVVFEIKLAMSIFIFPCKISN